MPERRKPYFVSDPGVRTKRRKSPKLTEVVKLVQATITPEEAAALTTEELDAAIMESLKGSGNGNYLTLHNEHADRLFGSRK